MFFLKRAAGGASLTLQTSLIVQIPTLVVQVPKLVVLLVVLLQALLWP